MKVSRALVGRVVEIQWMDPGTFNVDLDKLPLGRAALATWLEWGRLQDVTDGVLLVAHSVGTSAGDKDPDEVHCSAIHEALVEKLTAMSPDKES